jgi:hypothetical protein
MRQNIFYAESWALVHFLVCGRDRATYLPELRRFKELSAAPGRTIDGSFREAFGMSYEDMEANLRHIAIFLTASPGVSAELRGWGERLFERIPAVAEPTAAPAPGGAAALSTAK